MPPTYPKYPMLTKTTLEIMAVILSGRTRNLLKDASTRCALLVPPVNINGDILMIGLAPEGTDSPTGALTPPPNGIGRFITLFTKHGLLLLPVGVFEDHGQLCVCVSKLQSSPPPPAEQQKRECETSDQVMRAIARSLPIRLHGPDS